MDYRLHVHEIPEATGPDELAGGTVVVIDVLRATTTIIHALAAGAIEVRPCLEIEDARALAAKMPEGEYVLGGERGGLPIPGFHLGNRPSEYTPQTVGGKTVIFTTTNGTRAMMLCRRAARVFLGAFVNASAVVERLAVGPALPAGKAGSTTLSGQEDIHLLCAGSGGVVTRDDVLFAGLLVTRLVQRVRDDCQLNPHAIAARDDWTAAFPAAVSRAGSAGRQSRPCVPDPETLAAELRKGKAGQRLVKIGLQDDILAAAQIDRFRSVPELDPRTLRIRLGRREQ